MPKLPAWLRTLAWVAAAALVVLAGVRLGRFGASWPALAVRFGWLLAITAAFDLLRRYPRRWLGLAVMAALALAALAVVSGQLRLALVYLALAVFGLALRLARRPAWAQFVAGSGVLAFALAAAALLLSLPGRPSWRNWLFIFFVFAVPLANLAYRLGLAVLRRAGLAVGPWDLPELLTTGGLSPRAAGVGLAAAGMAGGFLAVVFSLMVPSQAGIVAVGITWAALALGLPWMVRRWQPALERPGSLLQRLQSLLFAPGFERRLDVLLLGSILSAVFYAGITLAPFTPDESSWISTSYLLELFVQRDFAAPAWTKPTLTTDQPPLVRYIVGLGRRMGGYGPDDLNKGWNFSSDQATNEAAGSMPSPDLLWWSRLSMAILSVFCGLALYSLVGSSAGRLAGNAATLLFVSNAYLRTMLPRAMGEPALLTFVTLAAWAASRASAHWPQAGGSPRAYLRPFVWFTVSGIFGGLAGASKLNGLLAAAAAAALVFIAPFARRGGFTVPGRWLMALGAAALVLLAAGITFVALNPFLYPDPVGRLESMIVYRQNVMAKQAQQYQDTVIDTMRERLAIVPRRVLSQYQTVHFPRSLYVNSLLGAIGLAFLLRASWRYLFMPNESSASLAILLFGLAMGVPPLFTPLDWDRYYLMPVVFTLIGIAIGLARSLLAAGRLGQRIAARALAL
jgi:hypothetical protein